MLRCSFNRRVTRTQAAIVAIEVPGRKLLEHLTRSILFQPEQLCTISHVSEGNGVRVRIIIAALVLVFVGGALISAETLIRRPVSFQVIAQTEVVEGRIAPGDPHQPLIFEIASAQVCDGADWSAPTIETPGRCAGFARIRKMVAGEVIIQGAVEGRVLRRGKSGLIVELIGVGDVEPTNTCDEGIAALLQVRPATQGEEPKTLCSPTRIAVPATVTEMPRLTLRGVNGGVKTGHVAAQKCTTLAG